jgi:hypothetical protein
MSGVVGQKKQRVGGGAKKRVVDSLSDKSFADTDNKRGIVSKKARGVAMSKEGSSFSSRTMTRVGKDKVGEEQRKLETHLGYDYTSSSGDSIPEATVYESVEEEIKRSRQDLLKIIDEKDKKIGSLELKISKSKMPNRHIKRKVREEYPWTGEETNFTKTVNHFCKNFLFPRYKFLKVGWQDVLPERPTSLYSLCMQKLKIPEGADKRDILEKVAVPSIRMKYSDMKCNLNNNIKSIHLSMINVYNIMLLFMCFILPNILLILSSNIRRGHQVRVAR